MLDSKYNEKWTFYWQPIILFAILALKITSSLSSNIHFAHDRTINPNYTQYRREIRVGYMYIYNSSLRANISMKGDRRAAVVRLFLNPVLPQLSVCVWSRSIEAKARRECAVCRRPAINWPSQVDSVACDKLMRLQDHYRAVSAAYTPSLAWQKTFVHSAADLETVHSPSVRKYALLPVFMNI